MSKRLILFLCAILISQRSFAEFVCAQSVSRQFIVYGPATVHGAPHGKFPLDPNFLAVSCERVKQATLSGLSDVENWKANLQHGDEGKIYVVLHPGMEQKPVITPIPTAASFSYRIDLPNQLEGARLIETVSETVLLEMANRHSKDTFAQVPQWLARGVAARVKSTSPETLLLQANFPISQSKVKNDPIVKICKDLETFPPLTLDELSHPEKLSTGRAAHFDDCAELFVHELSRLKEGDDALRKFLEELPRHADWRDAFLAGFNTHFTKIRDVEKWWDLRLVTLTGRDASQLWSMSQSIEMLEAALRVAIQTPGQKMSVSGAPTLQEIVTQWKPTQQKPALERVINQLRASRMRMQPQLVVLLNEYYGALQNYLDNSEKQNLLKRLFVRQNLADLQLATRERLDALDHIRLEARNKPRPATREEAMLSALEISSRTSQNAAARKPSSVFR